MTQAEPIRELQSTLETGLEVEKAGAATVARICRAYLVDDKIVNPLGAYLLSLVMDLGCRRLVVNFAEVKRLSSAMLGKIVALQKRMQKMGGRLALCRIAPLVFETIQTLHLDQFFSIFVAEEEALRSMQ